MIREFNYQESQSCYWFPDLFSWLFQSNQFQLCNWDGHWWNNSCFLIDIFRITSDRENNFHCVMAPTHHRTMFTAKSRPHERPFEWWTIIDDSILVHCTPSVLERNRLFDLNYIYPHTITAFHRSSAICPVFWTVFFLQTNFSWICFIIVANTTNFTGNEWSHDLTHRIIRWIAWIAWIAHWMMWIIHRISK